MSDMKCPRCGYPLIKTKIAPKTNDKFVEPKYVDGFFCRNCGYSSTANHRETSWLSIVCVCLGIIAIFVPNYRFLDILMCTIGIILGFVDIGVYPHKYKAPTVLGLILCVFVLYSCIFASGTFMAFVFPRF